MNRFCLLWYMPLIYSILKNVEPWFTAGVPLTRYFQVESELANPVFLRGNVLFISAEFLSTRGVKSSRLLRLQVECYLTTLSLFELYTLHKDS